MPAPLSTQQHTTNQLPLVLSIETPVHFIGIGGIGMSGLAKVLLQAGFKVSGSDLSGSGVTETLTDLGATIFIGHQESNLPEAKAIQVIVSTAVGDDNPEIAKALRLGYGIYHRSELLREIMHGEALGHQATVGISGTHGKTSITGMTATALCGTGGMPTVIVGGLLPQFNTNAMFDSDKKTLVAELDESDGSVIQYRPDISVICNLELDHAEHYPEGLKGIVGTFNQYLMQLKPGSTVLFNPNCEQTCLLMANLERTDLTRIAISLTEVPADVLSSTKASDFYWIKNVRHHGYGAYQGMVYHHTRLLGELHMNTPGQHQLMNGLFAIAIGDQLDHDFDDMADALRQFTGMGRRFEAVGDVFEDKRGAKYYDDYAHHPTEVLATLKAAREMVKSTGTGRVVAVYQPHRYTRLKALWKEFITCFELADVLYLTDVYAAHEDPIEGACSSDLAKAIQKHFPDRADQIHYVPLVANDFSPLRQAVMSELKLGDVALSMGAGNITRLFREK